jgi:hypothetical protein
MQAAKRSVKNGQVYEAVAPRIKESDLGLGVRLQHRSGTPTRYVVTSCLPAHKNKDNTITPERWRIERVDSPGSAQPKTLKTLQLVYQLADD